MEVLKKILKVSVSAALFLGPLFYFGGKAVPMITESIQFTKKVSAKNQKNREARLTALEELTVNEHAAKASAEIHEPEIAQAELKKTVVIESAYDPSDEAKIKAMFIPEATKRAILENYRRTGFLPEGLVADRKPANAEAAE